MAGSGRGTSPRRPSRGRNRSARSRAAGRRPPFLLRPATLGDLRVLVGHRRAMWEAIGRGTRRELDVHDRAYRRWVRAEWAAGRFTAVVATEPGGRPLGSGAVWLTPSQPRPGRLATQQTPYILSMFTEDDARGRGVASGIVRALVLWCRDRGYPRVTLHASKMGRDVYARLGFRPTNEMRLDLRRPRRGGGRPGGRRRV